MATTASTSLLGLALPVTGELDGTWGDIVNDSITSLLDSAIAGTTTLSSDGDVTLTTTALAANTAREAILLWTAGGTDTRYITAPAQSKTYVVINQSSGTQSIVLRGDTPTTGVTIVKGESAVCAWDGSDFVKVANTFGAGSFTNLTYTGTLTGGTGIVNLGSNQFYKNANGSVGIGTSSLTGYTLRISKDITGSGASYAIYNDGTIQSDVANAWGMRTGLSTAASVFTVANLRHYEAQQLTIGAGSTVTNQSGFFVDNSLTGATNNYGFFSNIASGTNRWNFYASGTAQNYFAGNVLIGTTTSPAGSKELVLGGDYIEGVVAIGNSGTAKTIALTNGTVQTVTLTGNCTFTMPTAVAGKSFTVILNTGAGSFTSTFTSVKWPNNTAPTITTTASRWDILSFISDGTNWYGNFAQAYQ